MRLQSVSALVVGFKPDSSDQVYEALQIREDADDIRPAPNPKCLQLDISSQPTTEIECGIVERIIFDLIPFTRDGDF